MKRFTWLTFLLLLSLHGLVQAQTRTVTGKVTDTRGTGLPGVTVVVQGTTQGISTDAEGNYSVTAPDAATLVFSSIGYESKTLPVQGQSVMNVSLAESTQTLNEVVVTALNVARERKTLGYSVTEVSGESLTQAREINVTNSLVGKVAGLNVNSTAGGPGSSSNVIIRGVSSLGQTNQPLYVINGIPVESQPSTSNSGGQYDNAPDLGDAISNINPDDIETISVLKGAAASALYGYRGKAGVILITTKSAKGNDGIELNSNFVAQEIYNLTDWQYQYGQGDSGLKPATGLQAGQGGNASWGARIDGTLVPQFDGVLRPYVAQKDNLRNFYRTGTSLTNTLAFNKSFTGGSVRLSASDLHNTSTLPNSGLNRQTFNFAGVFDPFKRLTIDARANYILDQAHNRAVLGDGAGNANFQASFLPTTLDINNLRGPNGDGTTATGQELQFSTNNTYATNPYFAVNKFVNNTTRERLLSSITARYKFDNGLFAQGRIGRDGYTDRYTNVTPSGTAYRPLGSITELSTKYSDLNADGLVGKIFEIGSDFTIAPNVGASYRRTRSETVRLDGNDFAVFGVNTINNAKNKSSSVTPYDLEVQSVYGSADFSYRELFFVTGTYRNDWFSSLATPGTNNKLNKPYYGVSTSFVFSELWKPEALTFGKIRAGYSKVGQATNPYQTQLAYSFLGNTVQGYPLGVPSNANIPNRSLLASEATEFEVGTELGFLQNRLRLDVTYYNKKSTGEITNTLASVTSGYGGAVVNQGSIRNKGVELLLTITPVKSTGFTWTTALNGAYNRNVVLSLAGTQDLSIYATSRAGVGYLAQVVGKPLGQVMAFDYQRDAEGNVVLAPNGVPARGDLTAYGTSYHPWTGGWTNDFTVKNFNLGVLIDGKFGGKIFSATDYYATLFGLRKETLVGRDGTFGPEKILPQVYYNTLANNVSNQFVQDASFIKLRQVTLGYSFGSGLFNNHIKRLTLSLVARNLFFIRRLTDNIDPEGSFTALAQGLELGGVPPSRTFGLNLNAKF